MGLGLTVGILIDLQLEEDPEELARWESQFVCLNRALVAAGLPQHHEPVEAHADLPWDCQMYGYSGLHYLRRIAAHVAAGMGMPGPGDTHAREDPVLQQYYSNSSAVETTRQFTHLMWHSDCDGFYVPLAFRDVIVPDKQCQVWGDFIGSATTLLDECTTLAQVIHIPPDLDAESEEVENAADYHGEGPKVWQQYGIESFTCLRLMKACRLSLASGCAVIFT